MSSSASSKPTLYDIPVSNNGARVRLLLYWKGLESAFRVENPSALGGLKSEAYLALTRRGRCLCWSCRLMTRTKASRSPNPR